MINAEALNLFTATELPSALQFLKTNPNATIVAGATSFPFHRGILEICTQSPILNIIEIEELKKIRTLDSGLEIGASVSFASIFKIPFKRLPTLLYKALLQLSQYPIFFQATLGGNLCLKPYPGDLFLVLTLLGAHFELRSATSSRWVDASRLIEGNHITLRPTEILTRVKIPESIWNFAIYHSHLVQSFPKISVRFALLARINNNILEDFRYAIQLPFSPPIIQLTADDGLVGKTLPIGRREISWIIDSINAKIPSSEDKNFSQHQMVVKHLILEVFREINDYEYHVKSSKKE